MQSKKISLREYILAMEKVREYEDQLECPEGPGGIIAARCDVCGLKFPFTITNVTEPVNAGGTSIYYGECPYCGERTEILRV